MSALRGFRRFFRTKGIPRADIRLDSWVGTWNDREDIRGTISELLAESYFGDYTDGLSYPLKTKVLYMNWFYARCLTGYHTLGSRVVLQ